MREALGLTAVVLIGCGVSWAIINPNFTPKHLVEQADVVLAGPLKPTDKPMEWTLASATPIKGKPPAKQVLDLTKCDRDHVEDIQQALRKNGDAHVAFFAGTFQQQKRAYLHAGGMWLNVAGGAGNRWLVTGYTPQMSATFAGGTDMLIRMSQYLARDVDADVPVSAGVAWQDRQKAVKVGKLGGEAGGLAAVEIGAARGVHLFAASSTGDRLFKPKTVEFETTFQDVTAAARLDTKSRRFVWTDVNGDGLADLASWDGAALSVRLAGKDGKFTPAPAGWTVKLEAGCTGLAACSIDGKPGLLVSTYARPLWLRGDGKKGWTPAGLPGGGAILEQMGRGGACIVADLDGDGYADVLQPGSQGGALWKGTAKGFGKPVKTAVCGAGRAAAAVADFNEDGALDIFLAGDDSNRLWENDGRGNFRNVFRHSGSMSYKCPPQAAEALACDLNHDGRADLCLIYRGGGIVYHFNRGFRCFGEEGEVRLPGLAVPTGQPPLGQKALAVGDLNADGSQDLAVWVTNNDLLCYLNDQYDMPALGLRLAKGLTGPVTASCWMGEGDGICIGTAAVSGHGPPAVVCARYPGKCKVKWRFPGKGEQVKTVTVENGPVDVILAPGSQKPEKKK